MSGRHRPEMYVHTIPLLRVFFFFSFCLFCEIGETGQQVSNVVAVVVNARAQTYISCVT